MRERCLYEKDEVIYKQLPSYARLTKVSHNIHLFYSGCHTPVASAPVASQASVASLWMWGLCLPTSYSSCSVSHFVNQPVLSLPSFLHLFLNSIPLIAFWAPTHRRDTKQVSSNKSRPEIINFAVIKTPHLASMSDIYDINYQVSLPILFSAKSKVEHLENLSIAGKQKFWVMNSVHPVWFRRNFLLILTGHLKHETSSEPDNYQHRIISNSKKMKQHASLVGIWFCSWIDS